MTARKQAREEALRQYHAAYRSAKAAEAVMLATPEGQAYAAAYAKEQELFDAWRGLTKREPRIKPELEPLERTICKLTKHWRQRWESIIIL